MPVPSPPCEARAIAIRRDSSTINAIAGIRIATSSAAINGGDSNDPGSQTDLRWIREPFLTDEPVFVRLLLAALEGL